MGTAIIVFPFSSVCVGLRIIVSLWVWVAELFTLAVVILGFAAHLNPGLTAQCPSGSI